MSNILLIPIHLDALYLRSEKQVVEAMVEFSLLPYNNGAADVNSEVAYLSESLASQPFQDENLRLKPGVHLHWALPDSLTKGTHTAEGTVFPAVPNRWLIKRSRKDRNGKYNLEAQWVVESDYLFPEGKGEQAGSVSIPYPPDVAKAERQPFRYLGRAMPLAAWKESFPDAQYLKLLTAVGYGEPSFAAFYPNCHSVFGFHDDDFGDESPAGVRYEVAGWYGDTDADFIAKFKASATAEYKQQNQRKEPSAEDLKQMLASQLKWTCDLGGAKDFPDQMVCYARMDFAPDPGAPSLAANVSIAVGNTGTEALSAYLASVIVKEPHAVPATATPDNIKSIIEDQLEAAQLSGRLDHAQLDIGPKFIEARHEKGFTAISSGTLWQVSPESLDRQANADNAQAQAQITLPDSIAHLLRLLNLSQWEYDRALDEIESDRRQLFSDWYKYQLCAYPPEDSRDPYPGIDEVKHFLEVKGLAPLQRKIAATGKINIDLSSGKAMAAGAGAASGTLAGKLKKAIDDLQEAVDAYNADGKAQAAKISYKLKPVPAPRYWQPNEPVVLLSGPVITAMTRHGEDGRLNPDGLLECQLLTDTMARAAILGSAITEKLNLLQPASNQEKIGFSVWTAPPWHPFLLEWEVELFPVEDLSNQRPDHRHYAPDFIVNSYEMKENSVDLSVKPGKGAVTRAANVYTGSTLLTPQAGVQLKGDLEDYLRQELLSDYCTDKKIQLPTDETLFFKDHLSEILSWYKAAHCATASGTNLCKIIRAYELVTARDFTCLSQSLGGFNDALLMHKQTPQLAIADPLGFPEYQAFAARVAAAVEQGIRSAPAPDTDFNPIRSGALKINRLRLVDTFGQFLDLDCEQIVTVEGMKLAGNPGLIALSPRLAQPSRLNFRWLSATDDDQEMNDHPSTSPICGWLLANHLDNSLMIYDGQGKALGAINRMAAWNSAPGQAAPLMPRDISNSHLRKLVEYVLAEGQTFLREFLSTLDSALENIEPENYAQHPELGLLVGRPLALARASLNLELMGPPTIHQGWESFQHDLQRITRDANDFDHVRFPIRLGEFRQFNDGLAGYWKEKRAAGEPDYFYAPQSEPTNHPKIKTHANDSMTVYQTVRAEPQVIAMLIDPRGVAHATSGITPSKSINIPPDQFTNGLRAMEISFFSAPIMTDAGKLNLPLPEEAGFSWSWLQLENGAWKEISSIGAVNPKAVFSAQQELREGWLKLRES